jgi:protein TonB
VLVLGITLSLNVLIFLTIPFLSQIRDTQPEQSRIAGTPTMVSLDQDDSSQPDPQNSQEPPEPEKPKELPRPDFQPRQMEYSPPSPPELPELKIDMPNIDLGRIEISKPKGPKPATQPRPKPAPEPQKMEPKTRPKPATQKTRFSLGEVDSHPRLVHKVNPTYPFRAKRRGVEGKVVVRFLVDKQGLVSEFSVVQAEPEGVFEESALKAVTKWRFEPGMKDKKPVSTWVQVPIRFELSR